MDSVQFPGTHHGDDEDVSRRSVIRHLVLGGAGVALVTRGPHVAQAEEATPTGQDCVATAPPLEDGIGFARLLVGGIVHDMPAGSVEVRISRLAMAPGTTIEASALPYPALMYIETGTTACPGGPGRIGYGPDGTIIEKTTAEGIQYTAEGSTQYIPANIPDGAGNEGTTLMSSIILEFVPIAIGGTPAATA